MVDQSVHQSSPLTWVVLAQWPWNLPHRNPHAPRMPIAWWRRRAPAAVMCSWMVTEGRMDVIFSTVCGNLTKRANISNSQVLISKNKHKTGTKPVLQCFAPSGYSRGYSKLLQALTTSKRNFHCITQISNRLIHRHLSQLQVVQGWNSHLSVVHRKSGFTNRSQTYMILSQMNWWVSNKNSLFDIIYLYVLRQLHWWNEKPPIKMMAAPQFQVTIHTSRPNSINSSSLATFVGPSGAKHKLKPKPNDDSRL